MAFLILLAAVGGLAYRLTSPEERRRYLQIAKAFLQQLHVAATIPRPAFESFRESLRTRTRYVLVMPVIIAVNVAAVAGMLFGPTAIADSVTLVRWGANIGTRTTNGEWWRLLTSAFLHTGTLQLVVDTVVLIQLGAVVERLFGRLATGAVYISAGVLAGLVHLSARPIAIGIGTSAAIFGLYGLLLACLIWQALPRRGPAPKALAEPPPPDAEQPQPDAEQTPEQRITVPLIAAKRIGLVGVVFIACSALGGHAGAAEFTGLVVGLAYGLVVGWRVSDREPDPRWVGAAIAATAVSALACAMPLRNIADVKPELARVIAVEERTAVAYRTAFDRFKHGRMTAEALAQLAERTIVPELQAADARLQALQHIPPEHQPLVTDAREYLRLRCASWHVRADATRKANTPLRRPIDGAADAGWRLQAEAQHRSNLAAAGKAEGAERVSLEAFERVRRAAPAPHD